MGWRWKKWIIHGGVLGLQTCRRRRFHASRRGDRRIEITGATPIDLETITFADHSSRFYSTVATSGAPEKITWLDADGAVIDSIEVTLVTVDTAETVPSGLLPSGTSLP